MMSSLNRSNLHTVFSGSAGMGILWGFPQIFLLVWDGIGIEIQSSRQPCRSVTGLLRYWEQRCLM